MENEWRKKEYVYEISDKKDEILEAPEIGKVNKYTEYNLYGTSVFRDVWGEFFKKFFFFGFRRSTFFRNPKFLNFFLLILSIVALPADSSIQTVKCYQRFLQGISFKPINHLFITQVSISYKYIAILKVS